MPRIILTTCGTSLLESSCWNADDEELKPISTMADSNRAEKERMSADWANWISNNRNSSLAEKFNPACWNTNNMLIDLPAELASLRALVEVLKKKEPSVTLGTGDKIVLLHSANEKGKFCAETMKSVFKNKLNNALKDVLIDLKKFEGLDPKDATCMVKALREIWGIYKKEILDKRDTTKYIFNLTGGYKATAMTLAGLSSLLSSTIKVPILYLHEDSSFDNLFVMRWEKGSIELDSLDSDVPQKEILDLL